MINIYTASRKNQRQFSYFDKQKAFDYYNKIKHLERTELHYYFIAIFPKDLYILKSDIERANRNRESFLENIKQ